MKANRTLLAVLAVPLLAYPAGPIAGQEQERKTPAAQPAIEVAADRMGRDPGSQAVTASGHVVVTLPNGSSLTSDKAIVRMSVGEVTASGSVVITLKDGMTVETDKALVRMTPSRSGAAAQSAGSPPARATDIREAIRAGDLAAARRILSTDPAAAGSVLHWACAGAGAEMIDLLLQKGARVDARDPFGATPLHVASEFAEPGVVRMLLARGADPNARLDDGTTPLLRAVMFGPRPEVVSLLVSHGADISARESSGMTALHLAASHGHADLVGLLLSLGADPQLRDAQGRTPSGVTTNQTILELLGRPASAHDKGPISR